MTLLPIEQDERAHFQDAVAVVVGGTSGVGLATARRFAATGCRRLVIVGRDAGRAEKAAATIVEAGADAPRVLIGDLLDAERAEEIMAEVDEEHGRIDILINSINGTHGPSLLHATPIGELQGAIVSQLMGVVHSCRAALPIMQREGSGAIVNIASDAAKSATPGEAAIGAAMAGIVMFTRTLAIEAKRNGIRANVVTPSLIRGTGGFDRVMKNEFAAKLFGKAMGLAKLGVVEADDMAELIAFLCSPRSARLTGQAISLNGGISAY